ncbi:drug resistance transporter, EmrB/QacA subfamily [Catenulispora acidiphila DSM 44928]|uniref:Drug resistance transporter, EmrB/QacA subfamily n=1 Tax=Catenulispora acidiphila (strain DSM 44928 / JCM 14897 / NBRC 102108 / NRRL B-24433 / ID139908) TaxID=479433 RepID=C7QE67_CATAD|nr:DHA2 family efflux MFS transporter permease subunit [Catenulispora acidiphila]ACU76655.1 drug resistance transporter, EmrB/QacA subfamily [Catenulispora acidiphila DSM 44928]
MTSTVDTNQTLGHPESSPPDSGGAADKATSKLGRAVILALFAIIGADIMDLLDTTIMNIASPVLRTDLGASTSALQWIVAGYTLAFAVMLTTGGRLGDVFGRKRMFQVGISGFLLGSVLCSVAQTSGELIGARILQGAFAAVMIPQGLGMLRAMVPAEKMNSVFGIFGPMMGLAATLGPILGGWLVGADLFGLSWRAIFLVNVPVGIAALAFGSKVLPKDDHAADGAKPKLDIVGMLLATAGVMLLVYPLVQGRESGWPLWMFAMMAASIPTFGVFALHQRRRNAAGRDPFVVPTVFRKRSFVSGIAVLFAFSAAMSGVFFVYTLFMQIGLHFSALHAGLTMLPWSIGTIASMGASQALMPKVGPRRTLQAGMLVMAIGTVIAALLVNSYGATTTTWTLVAPLLVSGMGMGLIFGPIFGTVLGDLDDAEVGSASGLLNAMQQLAGAFGIAALGTVFFDKAGTLMTSVPAAATLVFAISAAILVVAWAAAFSMSKHTQEAEGH